mmetsp:Transcript_5144/g.15704  ORF Transcript_5144/g.15704 Transcript_5144/m.15704 type:complete len:227 (+) Transcript_5144:1665-2345(+)
MVHAFRNSVQAVVASAGQSDANTSSCITCGVCGTHRDDRRMAAEPPSARSIVATRRIAWASRGTMPFHVPQTFSQDSYPAPLNHAACRLSVLFLAHRSHTFVSHLPCVNHLYRSTTGTRDSKFQYPHPIVVQFRASSVPPPSGSKARGYDSASAAVQKLRGIAFKVSPFKPSAAVCFNRAVSVLASESKPTAGIRSAAAVQDASRRVPVSQGLYGHSTLTPAACSS